MKKYINKVNISLIILLAITFILLLLNSILNFKIPAEFSETMSDTVVKELKENDVIEATVKSRLKDLEALELEVTGVEDLPISLITQEDKIFVSIYDEEDNLIYYSNLADAEIFDDRVFTFKFDTIKDCLNEEFTIKIEAEKLTNGYTFELHTTEEDNKVDTATINGEKLDGQLPIKQYGYTSTTFYNTLFTVIFLVLSFIIFRYNFKDNEKIKTFLMKKKKVFIIEFLVSFIAAFSYMMFLYKGQYVYTFDIIAYALFVFSTLILLFILSIYIGDKKLKRENLFLLLAIPLGIMFLAFLLPLNAPDDYYHYKIALKVSEFNIVDSEISIPSDIEKIESIEEVFNSNYSYNNMDKTTAGTYHPLLYLFSGIGILISKLFNLSPIVGLYLGKMGNLLVFLIAGYYTIKKLPMGKLAMIIYMLSPMFLQQATSFSADAMINIFSMLFIAYVLYIKYEKKKVTTKDLIVLVTSYTFIFIGKYAYFLFILLLLLIWKELKEYAKNNKKKTLLMVILFMLISFTWMIYTKLPSATTPVKIDYDRPQTIESKLTHLIKNPLNFIPIYIRTLLYNTTFYITSFIGSSLGGLNISVNMLSLIIYIVILVLSIFMDNEKKELKTFDKIISGIIFFLTFNAILLGLYLGWGVITDTIIQGVQGRYFIPIMILLILMIIKKRPINLTKMESPLLILFFVNSILIIQDIITHFLV